VVKERELWAEMEQASLEQLQSQGAEIITDVDKQPFIEATQAVRDKFGETYGELIERIQAFAPES
jgi:TRAP-type C4-dicarboxylate transport system substrate-binding protein